MSSPPKVYVVGSRTAFDSLPRVFLDNGFALTNKIENASLVAYRGGADIGFNLYSTYKHPKTGSPCVDRDEEELAAYADAKRLGLPQVGICRGAQLLNVLNGGKLYQDVNNHCRSHKIFCPDTSKVLIEDATSVHHQMMIPTKAAKIIGISNQSTRREWVDGSGSIVVEQGSHDDPEIVYYDGALCWQGHPEWANPEEESYFFSLLRRLFFGGSHAKIS